MAASPHPALAKTCESAKVTAAMMVIEDSRCRYVKLGGYATRSWILWGEERVVPVTFAFELRLGENNFSRGSRITRATFDRLHALQQHTPVQVLCLRGRYWWWYQEAFYTTGEVACDAAAFLSALRHQRQPPQPLPPPPPAGSSASAFATLGVPRNATFEEIRQAYRLRISEYHPDKVASLGQELRRVAEEMTRKINQAYEELKAGRE